MIKESKNKHSNINSNQAGILQLGSLGMNTFSGRTGRPYVRKSDALTRVISFTSGKGGVGKTNSVINTAFSLAEEGRSVLILDADLGLANIDIILGLNCKNNLNDVLEGKCSISDIIVDCPGGISVIPAASGIESICNLNDQQRLTLMHMLEEVAMYYDYLLIDTRAGISPDVMQFNAAANEIVCVVTSEPTSLTDAYAMIKLLAKNYNEKSISILANNIYSTDKPAEEEAEAAFKRLQRSVDRFLKNEQVSLRYMGYIPADPMVIESVKNQRGLMEIYPSSKAGLAYRRFAKKLDQEFSEYRIKGGMQFFFRQLMEVNAYGC